MPNWRDARIKSSSSGLNIPALDSLRAVAALIVVADHTGIFSRFAGGLYGVALFFCLSGYLLAIPFAQSDTAYSPRRIGGYLHRRLWRILPMYVCYCLLAMLFYPHGTHWLMRHLLFIQADFHLWTVRQELLLYLLLPLLLALMRIVSHPFVKGGLLVALAVALCVCQKESFFEVTVTQKYNRFMISPFLEGMALACFLEGLRRKDLLKPLKPATANGMMLLLVLCPVYIYRFHQVDLWDYIWIVGLDFMLMIGVAQMLPAGYLRSFLQWLPLRSLGVIGYSFYLLHYPIRDKLMFLSGHPVLFFCLVSGLTYALACLTYALIEKPGMQTGKKLSARWSG